MGKLIKILYELIKGTDNKYLLIGFIALVIILALVFKVDITGIF